jgi:hypothetical protein
MKKIGMKRMVGARKRGAPMPKTMAAPKAMKPAEMEGQVPPMAGPMPQGMPGMKKGGAVKKMAKGGAIMGTGKTPAAARSDYEKKMKAAGKKPLPAAKAPKAGLGIMIILGKKKGK